MLGNVSSLLLWELTFFACGAEERGEIKKHKLCFRGEALKRKISWHYKEQKGLRPPLTQAGTLIIRPQSVSVWCKAEKFISCVHSGDAAQPTTIPQYVYVIRIKTCYTLALGRRIGAQLAFD